MKQYQMMTSSSNVDSFSYFRRTDQNLRAIFIPLIGSTLTEYKHPYCGHCYLCLLPLGDGAQVSPNPSFAFYTKGAFVGFPRRLDYILSQSPHTISFVFLVWLTRHSDRPTFSLWTAPITTTPFQSHLYTLPFPSPELLCLKWSRVHNFLFTHYQFVSLPHPPTPLHITLPSNPKPFPIICPMKKMNHQDFRTN
jgi:hypothetical protein